MAEGQRILRTLPNGEVASFKPGTPVEEQDRLIAKAFPELNQPEAPAQEFKPFDVLPLREDAEGIQLDMTQGAIGEALPFTRDPDGSLGFDVNKGVLGGVKRAIEAPHDAMTQPMSQNQIADRAMEMGGLISGRGVKPTMRNAPGHKRLLDVGGRQIEAVKSMPVQFKPTALKYVIDRLRRNEIGENADPDKIRSTLHVIEKYQKPVDPGAPGIPISQLINDRETLGEIAAETVDFTPTRDARAATLAIKELDKLLSKPGRGAVFTDLDQATKAGQMYADARANYAGGKRSQKLMQRRNEAFNQTGTANSGNNLGNTMRQKVNALLKKRNGSRGWTPDEMTDLETGVVRGEGGKFLNSPNWTRERANAMGGGKGGGMAHMLSGAGPALGAAGAMKYIGASDPTAFGVGLATKLAHSKTATELKKRSHKLINDRIMEVERKTQERTPEYQRMKRQGQIRDNAKSKDNKAFAATKAAQIEALLNNGDLTPEEVEAWFQSGGL